MSPRTPQQLQAYKTQRKIEFLDKALALFAQKGYFNTSINDLAQHLDISKGLLYSYFDSKEALLNEVFKHGMTKGLEMSIISDALKADLSPKQRLDIIIDEYFDSIKKSQELWRLLVSVSMNVSEIPSVHNTIHNIYKYTVEELTILFKTFPMKNPEEEALMFGVIFDGISMQYLMLGDDVMLEKIKNNIKKTYHQKFDESIKHN